MKLRFFLIFLFCSYVIQAGIAKEYKVNDVPLVHLQDRTRYVSNPDNILSDETVAAIDTTLFALEQETGVQTLVAVLEKIEGGDCFEFAFQLGQQNKVGQKGKDNGLVILLVTEERCIQFATGYGLEEYLPDAVCKQIQIRYMNSYFSKGNWDAGMLAGIQAIRQQLTGTGSPVAMTPMKENQDFSFIFIILGFILIPVLLWIFIRRSMRCPICHKHTLRQTAIRTLSVTHNLRTEEITLSCSHCGHTEKRKRYIRRNDDFHHHGRGGGMFGGGPFIGGGFGGSGGGFGRSNGGFGGGSYGGGNFGGGGAGSRF